MFILGIVTKFVSFVFIVLACKAYKLPDNDNRPTPTVSPIPPTESTNSYNMEQLAAVSYVVGNDNVHV